MSNYVVAGVAQDGAPESDRTFEDVFFEENDECAKTILESVVRCYGAFRAKSNEYNKNYSNVAGVVDGPFVIAIGDFSSINYGKSYIYSMATLLYCSFYDINDSFDLKYFGVGSDGAEYKYMDELEKRNGGNLKLGLFLDSSFEHVSAVMYSCTLTLGKLSSMCKSHIPFKKFIRIDRGGRESTFSTIRFSDSEMTESIGDGLFIFHNPYAKVPLPDDFLANAGVTHVCFDVDDSSINIQTNIAPPLSRRIVGPAALVYEMDDVEDFIFIPNMDIVP